MWFFSLLISSVMALSITDFKSPWKSPDTPCAKMGAALAKRWGAGNEFRANPDGDHVQYLYPTGQMSVWVGVDPRRDLLRLSRHMPMESLIVEMKPPECSPSIRIDRLENAKLDADSFTDAKLAEILAESRKNGSDGFVYAWSPRMNYSARGAKEAAIVGKELNLKAVVIEEKDLQSRELFFRGIRNHFPSWIYFSKGKFAGHLKTGYENPEILKEYLKLHGRF
jgi:hypothetical protein